MSSDSPKPNQQRVAPRASTVPKLPALEDGLTLLECDSETGPLQSLVVDHLSTTPGGAYWVDAKGRARTTSLLRLAPTPELLERIHVSRAFTPYQHYRSVERLAASLDDEASPPGDEATLPDDEAALLDGDPALVVCPALDAFYRDADRGDGERLFAAAVDRLSEFASDSELPVLVTLTQEDGFTDPLGAVAPERIRCTDTRFGPRFVGESSDFETLVYPDGRYVQTTLAFWERVLRRRRAAAAADATGVTPVGAD